MYHRVAELEFDPWEISVSPVHFEEHMRVLEKFGSPVKVSDLEVTFGRFPFMKKKIAVTFDDGYADNYHNAKPVLERYGIPATFFIMTGAIDSREEFWWDEIGRAVLAAEFVPAIFDFMIAGKRYHWEIKPRDKSKTADPARALTKVPSNGTVLSRMQLYYVLWEIISHLSVMDKKIVIKEIVGWAGIPSGFRTDHLPMTSLELKSLARSGTFEIGAHTVNHPHLSRFSPDTQEEEIGRSKHDLERLTGNEVTSFAYPHGDYTVDTVHILKRLKFQKACTVNEQPVMCGVDPLLLPRFMVRDWDGDQFERHLDKWMRKAGAGN